MSDAEALGVEPIIARPRGGRAADGTALGTARQLRQYAGFIASKGKLSEQEARLFFIDLHQPAAPTTPASWPTTSSKAPSKTWRLAATP